jgi:hypothetical protein
MKPKMIAGANANPGAPRGWDPKKDGHCGTLPIRYTEDADGRIAQCESAWEPSAEELALLNAGGSVILRVIGWQVPVALYVEPADKAFQNSRRSPRGILCRCFKILRQIR